jgi:site-specific DNA recombinase
LDAPALRIVSEELWRAAHARLDRTRQTYLRQTGGRLYGRPKAGIQARHLLSGFLVCGCCDGAMHAIRRTSKRGGPKVYFVCNNWRVNGACDSSKSVLVRDMDTSVIEALRAVLTPDLVRDVIARARALGMEEPDQLEQRRRGYVEEETRLKQEIGR